MDGDEQLTCLLLASPTFIQKLLAKSYVARSITHIKLTTTSGRYVRLLI